MLTREYESSDGLGSRALLGSVATDERDKGPYDVRLVVDNQQDSA
jgi:hypothetical protein